ncbi:sigma factor-like helix-turn-helix DNA-binding protein [Streptomyces sp. NPDC006516]|uniref:sigma factor-like helix-turn-helix DNA-binding protein n=1 Tax=Streptomyces sp. NPDC006516 TaxID=3154309 RepID=UPI0033A57C70
MGIHIRRAGEYIRPAGRILLDDYGRAEGEYYASGAYYLQESLSRFDAGQKVEAELVPEPCNPWDARAVAYDVEGERAAYLPATAAKMWHDVVRGWNAAGFAVYVAAEVNRWESDGEVRFGLTVPKWDWQTLLAMAEAAGLRKASQAAMEGLTEEQRLLMREDGGYTPHETTLKALWRKREQHPACAWGGKRDGDLSERMPFWYGYFVREQMREEEERLRFARSVKSALTRGFKDEIRRRKERERERERLLRGAQVEHALRLHGEGRRNQDIAAELGLTPKQVESLLHRARKAAGITLQRNEDLRKERYGAAAEALRHKRSGMARAQIARAMGRSVDSVKELLQDAVFYEAPDDHPERLELARHCTELRGAGLLKEQVLEKLGVTRAKGLRAFRDASFLESRGVAQGEAAPSGL